MEARRIPRMFKGCEWIFLTFTMLQQLTHLPYIRQYVALENYNNTDHQFSKHDFQWQFLSLPKRQDRRVIIKGSKFEYALGISFIVTRYMFQL